MVRTRIGFFEEVMPSRLVGEASQEEGGWKKHSRKKMCKTLTGEA